MSAAAGRSLDGEPAELEKSKRRFGSRMSRAEIEAIVQPMIENCLREFGDLTPKGISAEEFASHTVGTLRPDVRRVSLLLRLALDTLGVDQRGEGLEVGAGYGFLLFPLAKLLPEIHWTGLDHPGRAYAGEEAYRRAFREHKCEFATIDLLRQLIPAPDGHFQVVTFSEVLEHLPVERVNFVLSEVTRVVAPGGVLIASSPNQASLENRVKLMRGRSILEFPSPKDSETGIFGHIRLYTPREMETAMAGLGFCLERSVMESNNSGYRGASNRSWRRRLHRAYEFAESKLGLLARFADTWHMAFRKKKA